MSKKELEQRSYSFEISAEESEAGNVITGRPIVYGSRANIGLFDEIIHPGALDKADLKDVRFLVNHDTSKIPLARSRRNNGNSTMQLMVDENGMSIKVMLDTENNAEARALYSAVQRGDISGMSFMFGVDQDDWDNLETDHPTRNIRSINNVVEVSAVTFPAYEATEINTRSKETLDEARSALDQAKESQKKDHAAELELEKEKLKTIALRYNTKHDAKGRFASGSGGSTSKTMSKSDVTNSKIRDFYDEYKKQTGTTGSFDAYKAQMKEQYNEMGGDDVYGSFDNYVSENHKSFFPEKYKNDSSSKSTTTTKSDAPSHAGTFSDQDVKDHIRDAVNTTSKEKKQLREEYGYDPAERALDDLRVGDSIQLGARTRTNPNGVDYKDYDYKLNLKSNENDFTMTETIKGKQGKPKNVGLKEAAEAVNGFGSLVGGRYVRVDLERGKRR